MKFRLTRALLILLLAVTGSVAPAGPALTQSAEQTARGCSPVITEQDWAQVHRGMRHRRVNRILGTAGQVYSGSIWFYYTCEEWDDYTVCLRIKYNDSDRVRWKRRYDYC